MSPALKVIQLVPDAFEHMGTMGMPFSALSSLYERTSLSLDIHYMAQKHIRSNLDTVMFNKNTLRYFCFMYTLNVQTFGHYCIVMYKCNIYVFITILIYIQALKFQMTSSQ